MPVFSSPLTAETAAPGLTESAQVMKGGENPCWDTVKRGCVEICSSLAGDAPRFVCTLPRPAARALMNKVEPSKHEAAVPVALRARCRKFMFVRFGVSYERTTELRFNDLSVQFSSARV